jgi:hypothetical protein
VHLIVKKNTLEAKIYHYRDKIVVESADKDFQKKIQDFISMVGRKPLKLPWGEITETKDATIVSDGYRVVARGDRDYLHALATELYDKQDEFGINLYFVDSKDRIHPYHPLRYFLEEK